MIIKERLNEGALAIYSTFLASKRRMHVKKRFVASWKIYRIIFYKAWLNTKPVITV